MNKSRLYTLSLIAAIALSLLLAACSSGPPPPAEATVNGVTSIDRVNGSAQFSVSGLNANGEVVTSGTIGDVSGTVDQAGFEVDPGVCGEEGQEGQITSLGPVIAALSFDATPSLTDNCAGSACPPVPNDPFDENGNTVRREGGLDFVANMKSEAQVAISYFNGADGLVTVQGFTSDKDMLEQAVIEATSPDAIGGGTPLWAASENTIELLSSIQGENRIAVIFTDGQDTTFDNPSAVETAAQSADVRVFYIGLGEAQNVDAMIDIAKATEPNGLYVSAKDKSELLEAFDGVVNSSQAAGCIGTGFSPIPAPGQTMTGTLSFTIDGAPFTGDYEVTF